MTAVAFTGTQFGMTIIQQQAFADLLSKVFQWAVLHVWRDGDCTGADAEAHLIVEDFRRPHPTLALSLIGHPCDIEKKRAFSHFDISYAPRPPIERNHEMVTRSTVLIAAPAGPEKVRSGTWATVRYARTKSLHIYIVWPDGTITEENA